MSIHDWEDICNALPDKPKTAPAPSEREIADWLLATLRMYGCTGWRAYQIVGLFLEGLENEK